MPSIINHYPFLYQSIPSFPISFLVHSSCQFLIHITGSVFLLITLKPPAKHCAWCPFASPCPRGDWWHPCLAESPVLRRWPRWGGRTHFHPLRWSAGRWWGRWAGCTLGCCPCGGWGEVRVRGVHNGNELCLYYAACLAGCFSNSENLKAQCHAELYELLTLCKESLW